MVSSSVVLILLLIVLAGYLLSDNASSACDTVVGTYYIEETGRTYRYERKVFGKLPNAAEPIWFYVYSDDPDMSFVKASQILTSSQSHEFDIYISETPISNAD